MRRLLVLTAVCISLSATVSAYDFTIERIQDFGNNTDLFADLEITNGYVPKYIYMARWVDENRFLYTSSTESPAALRLVDIRNRSVKPLIYTNSRVELYGLFPDLRLMNGEVADIVVWEAGWKTVTAGVHLAAGRIHPLDSYPDIAAADYAGYVITPDYEFGRMYPFRRGPTRLDVRPLPLEPYYSTEQLRQETRGLEAHIADFSASGDEVVISLFPPDKDSAEVFLGRMAGGHIESLERILNGVPLFSGYAWLLDDGTVLTLQQADDELADELDRQHIGHFSIFSRDGELLHRYEDFAVLVESVVPQIGMDPSRRRIAVRGFDLTDPVMREHDANYLVHIEY